MAERRFPPPWSIEPQQSRRFSDSVAAMPLLPNNAELLEQNSIIGAVGLEVRPKPKFVTTMLGCGLPEAGYDDVADRLNSTAILGLVR